MDDTTPSAVASRDPEEVGAAVRPAVSRGDLLLRDRVVARVTEGVFSRSDLVVDAKVATAKIVEGGVDLSVEITMRYPDRRLCDVLTELRVAAVTEVERQLGRRVQSLNLTIDEFADPRPERRVR